MVPREPSVSEVDRNMGGRTQAAARSRRGAAMNAPLRGILIARVSTKKQAAQDRFSMDSQFRMMRDCCERRGIEIVDERVEPGRSAFTPNLDMLPVLKQAIEDIEAGRANCLVMHETTRLARNEQLGNHILDRLTAVGAQFINSLMEIDYTTPEGRMFFNNEVAMASYTSRKTSQHSKKGKREQYLQGLQVGQVAFGYVPQLNEDGQPNRKLPMVTVPEEAGAIRKAYEDYAMGANAHQIAREWNELGFKPRSTKGLDYFQPQTVRDILRNPLYTGKVSHLGEVRMGLHEPIITEEEFLAAQRPVGKIVRRRHPPLLLRGVASCGHGHRVYDHHPRGKDHYTAHHYYREPSKDFQRPCPQAGKLWPAAEIDRRVESVIRSMAVDGAWLEYVEREAHAGGRDTAKERARIQTRLERAQEDYWSERLAKEKWDAIYAECTGTLARLAASETPLSVTSARLISFWALWEGAPAEVKNETCRLVFASAVLDFEHRNLSLVPNPEFEPLFRARSGYVEQDSPGRG